MPMPSKEGAGMAAILWDEGAVSGASAAATAVTGQEIQKSV